ncbi:MAG TPA: hypothetical protein PLT33_06745 [Deltaproteobacteria bacterium]|jgi:hypothetical protein|nr:MAG: ATP-dependent zinc metalloprotease FtsH [Deltaproteobacteria bacterium ADurb.Bin072]HNQ85581.1 hypothetical protein [Deltaproteobacteria bacterium]HNS89093.1 hypothetical protein [Deltaproteobacteria bacterium]HOA43841.1 hypothetical protein [Deltaproteobacteria bacterium]HOC76063.1 hypothetical protein [Deltaproteobacteria bacterium]
MNRKRATKKNLIAYHEAGHAVAAYLTRKKFKYVTIKSNKDYEGYMRHEEQRATSRPEWDERRKTRSSIEKDIMVSLAGSAAIFLLTGHRERIGAWADRRRAMDLAENICDSRRECEAFVNWLYVRVEGILRSQANWHAVETLAEELMILGSIGYQKAVHIIRAAKRQFRRRRWKDIPRQVLMFPVMGR